MFFLWENLYRLGYFAIYLGVIQSIFMILKKYVRQLNSFIVLPDDKKDYALKNIFKSFVLFLFMPLATYILYLFFIEDRHDTILIVVAGWIYSACDIIGLINVKLPQTTMIHHSIVTIFAIMSTLMNHTKFTFFTPIILYGALCSYTFSVNLFLGIRHLYPDAEFTYIICRISYWVYSIVVGIIVASCLYCYYLMLGEYHPALILLIMAAVGMLWRDDFILLGWLKNYYRNTIFYMRTHKKKKME